MSGYAGMEATDEIVEYLLVAAEQFVITLEAILAVDQLPNGRPVVIGETLDVSVDVEVLPTVIALVLHVPYPPRLRSPLRTPEILALRVRQDPVSVTPLLWYIPLITSADSTRIGLADEVADTEGALLVDIEADDAEVLGLDELVEQGSCRLSHLQHWVCLKLWPLGEEVETQQVQTRPQNYPGYHDNINRRHIHLQRYDSKLSSFPISSVSHISKNRIAYLLPYYLRGGPH